MKDQTHQRQPRKQPRQTRSKATVDALLDATARVLVREGYAAASTNRIAETAGVSIGSLYQYFPSKVALVVALRERHSEQMGALLKDRAAKLVGVPLPVAVDTLVDAALEAHLIDPQLHRALSEQLPRPVMLDGREDIGGEIQALLKGLLMGYRKQILPQDIDLASRVLMRTVEALVHAAIDDGPQQTAMADMQREIKAIVLRYLVGAEA